MLLDFKILSDDGMLEAVFLDYRYDIYQMNGYCIASVNGCDIFSGNIYNCLKSCNDHAYNAEIQESILDIEKILDGLNYVKVNRISFLDKNGSIVTVTPRKFSSIAEIRDYIEKLSLESTIYVYEIREVNFYNDGKKWFHLKCAVRRFD